MAADDAGPPILPVALVIPVLNEAETLGDLFDAWGGFTARPAEIVFVDAGSADGTPALAERWCAARRAEGIDARVLARPGAMPGAGLNAGVAASAAPWVAFLDAGIRPEKDWLARLYAAAKAGGRGHALGLCRFDAEGAVSLAACALSHGVGRRRPFLAASVFSRPLFGEARGFAPGLRAGEDRMFLAAVDRLSGGTVRAEDALVHYRRYPRSLGALFRKWAAYEAAVTGTPVGRRKRLAVAGAAAALVAAVVAGWPWWLLALLGYAALRGVADPIRRSRAHPWWSAAPGAALITPAVAAAIDAGSLFGAIRGGLRRLGDRRSA